MFGNLYSLSISLFFLVPAVTKLVGSDPVEFEQPEYEVTVPENTRQDHLLRLSARVRLEGTCVPPGYE